MRNSSYFFKYLVPFILITSLIFYIFHNFIHNYNYRDCYIYLIVLALAILPRLFLFFDDKFHFKINDDSFITRFINNMDSFSEDGKLNRYYSVFYGYSNNRNRLFKLSTIYFLVYFCLASFLPHLKSSQGIYGFTIIGIFMLFPFILIIVHFVSLKFGILNVIFNSIVYYLLFNLFIIASYIAWIMIVINFILRIFPFLFLIICMNGFREDYRDNE